MYLFYIDESGEPYGWNNQDNFILAGVAVHEGQIRNLSLQLDDVQRAFFPDINVPLEFHADDIHGGRNRFRKMDADARTAYLDQAYDVLTRASFPGLVTFITAIHITAVTEPSQAFRMCLEDICVRFNAFLIREFKAGFPNKGMMIFDKSGRETRVMELMADFGRYGTTHGSTHGFLGNIVDVPYFADSHRTRMLQLADLVAYAAYQYFNRNNDVYLNKVWPRMDRVSPEGAMVGFKHIVGSHHWCSCRAGH